MVTLTINGKKVRAKEKTTLLEIAQKLSIPIPTLCYHPALSPYGSCRLCIVEISKDGRSSRMVTACNYPVQEGIEVETHSRRVLQARRVLVELLLARSPSAPLLQRLAEELGADRNRFSQRETGNDCILCGLCIRTCQELVGANAIGFSMRGTGRKVGTPFEVDSEKCVACGACEYICPTDAIKMEMDRIKKMRMTDTGVLRACRYVRMGLIDFMVCSNGFECWRCEVDQTMEDRFGTHPIFALQPARKALPMLVSGFSYHPDLYYSENHVWCKPLGPLMKLGLDEIGSLLTLGAEELRLPPPGTSLDEKAIFAEISSRGNGIGIVSPLGGVVSAVNARVLENPSLVWRDPYRRGWLILLRPNRPEDVSKLLANLQAKDWYSRKASKLFRQILRWAPNPVPKGELLEDASLVQILRKKAPELTKIILGA